MNKFDAKRNAYMLQGPLGKKGYVRWWHSFTGIQPETKETRTFFVEYMIVNPALGTDAPIWGQHPYYKKRGMKPSYAMVKAGVFPDASGNNGKQLHGFYPISSLIVAQNPLHIEMEDCLLSETRIMGTIDVAEDEAYHRFLMTDSGYMKWNLEIHKTIACHTGAVASPLSSILGVLQSFWHGEGIRSYFRGTVVLDGVTYQVSTDNCYGYADKHWGRSYNIPWLQLASCNLLSERTGKELKHSAFALDGCCPKFLCFPLRRKLMIQLTYTGEDFEYHFARPGSFSRCKWKVKETNKRFIWHMKAQNKTSVINISLSCTKDGMMPLNYETPEGKVSKYPLLAGSCGTGTIAIYRRVPDGLQWIDTLTVGNTLCEYQNEN